MLTPDKLDYMLDSMKVQKELEEGIIRDIARRISKTGFVTETADWQAERARQAGILREDVIKRVATVTGKREKEIRQLFKESKLLIFDGSDRPTIGMDHIWNAALKKTCTSARNLTKTIAVTSQKSYLDAVDMAHMEIMSGAFTYDTAITNAVKKAAEDGCRVRYPSGKTTSVEAAVRRAVLTGVNQTSGKLCEMRCDELDCDLVEVSAHYGARPTHAEWQGGVYSRSGKHPEYESLVDATGYGTGDGLMGWNCNHSMAPFFEGLSKRNYTDEQLRDMREHTVEYNGRTMTDYEASQLKRSMERKIRRSKNSLTALDEQGKATPSLEQKNAFAAESVRLKAREGRLRDFCKQTGRRSDSLRTRTASWNRSTSQKAVWANKKAVDNKGRSGIITIRSPISSRNAYKGRASAVYTLDVELNKRQQRILSLLPEYDSETTLKKSDVSMSDLSALTAKTGVEFAMFTRGSERLIIRGGVENVNVNLERASELARRGYKFSGHTHPGGSTNVLIASGDDYEILRAFKQTQSVTYNSKGQYMTYELR